MTKVTETVEVSKELNDVRKALVKVVKSSKEAVADGFQAGQDIPAIAMASYQELLEALKGLNDVPAEFKEDLGASVRCAGLLAGDLTEVLAK